MAEAICGRDCTVSVTGSATCFGAHSLSMSMSANVIDTTAFGDDEFGSVLACGKAGEITVNCYELPTMSPGDETEMVIVWAYDTSKTYTFNVTVTSVGPSADAKAECNHSISFRMTGALVIT